MSGTHGLHLGAVCQYEGYFFVQHLKGNSGDPIKKLADSQATRKNVANAVVCAQKISVVCEGADDTSEVEEIWKSVSNCVLDHTANKDEDFY